MEIKAPEHYQALDPAARLEEVKVWATEEFEGWRYDLLMLLQILPDDSELDEAFGIVLEELPLAINDYEEGTLAHDIVKYRIEHALEAGDMSQEEWVESDVYREYITLTLRDMTEWNDENYSSIRDAVNGIWNVHRLVTLIGDPELLTRVSQYLFNM